MRVRGSGFSDQREEIPEGAGTFVAAREKRDKIPELLALAPVGLRASLLSHMA